VGFIEWVGVVEIVRVDGKGRVLIPKRVREALGIVAGSRLRVKVVDGRIVLEPVGSVAEKYYGVVRVERWPRDIDEFLVEAVREWLRKDM